VKLLLAILVFSKLPVIFGSKNGMNASFSLHFIPQPNYIEAVPYSRFNLI
jgi:hypothetical protein